MPKVTFSSVRRQFIKSAAFSGAVFAGLTVSSVSWTPGVFAQEPVKVGYILPLTGNLASFGQEAKNGMELALSQVSKDVKITPIVEDSQSNTQGSAAAANKLLKSDKVSVIIGELTSSNTIAAAAPAQTAKIPLMSPAATNDTITKDKDFISRICFIDSFQGAVMAKFAMNDLKAKKAVIMVDSDSDYSRGLRDSFKASFGTGGNTVTEVSYSSKDTDFKAQLTKVRKEKPDVVFVPGYYNQVGAILRQASELKIKAKFLGGDGWDSPDLFKVAGKAVVGHYLSNHFAPDDKDPKVQNFVKTYQEKYKVAPGAMAALTYDATVLIAKVLQETKTSDPIKIKDAIAATKDFEGVTGKISLDANRNATKPAVILQTTESGYKFISRVNP